MLDINQMKRIIFIILLNPDADPQDPLGAIIQVFFQQQGKIATLAYEGWTEILTMCQRLSREIFEQNENPMPLPYLSAEILQQDPRILDESKKLITNEKLKDFYRFVVALDPLAQRNDKMGAIILTSYGELGQTGCISYDSWAEIVPKLQEHAETLHALHKGPLGLPPVPEVKAAAPKTPPYSTNKGKTGSSAIAPAPKKPSYKTPFTLEQKGKRRILMLMTDDPDVTFSQNKNKQLEFKDLLEAIRIAITLATQDNIAITIRDKDNMSVIVVEPKFAGTAEELLASFNSDTGSNANSASVEAENGDNQDDEEIEEAEDDSDGTDFDEDSDSVDDDELTEEDELGDDSDGGDEENDANNDSPAPYSMWLEELKIEFTKGHPMTLLQDASNTEYEFEDLNAAFLFAENLANFVGSTITIRATNGSNLHTIAPTETAKS
jgi:hypothetical protein